LGTERVDLYRIRVADIRQVVVLQVLQSIGDVRLDPHVEHAAGLVEDPAQKLDLEAKLDVGRLTEPRDVELGQPMDLLQGLLGPNLGEIGAGRHRIVRMVVHLGSADVHRDREFVPLENGEGLGPAGAGRHQDDPDDESDQGPPDSGPQAGRWQHELHLDEVPCVTWLWQEKVVDREDLPSVAWRRCHGDTDRDPKIDSTEHPTRAISTESATSNSEEATPMNGFTPPRVSTLRRLASMAVIAAFAVAGRPLVAGAIMFDDPALSLGQTWSNVALNLPQNLGGLFFSEDGANLYVVGDADNSSSELYSVPVTRDPGTGEVVMLGPNFAVTRVFGGTRTGLDAGWAVGPQGTLFYTYWDSNWLGQRPGGVTGTDETLFDLSTIGVPVSAAGLTFSPHRIDPGTGSGTLQISTNDGQVTFLRDIYEIPLTPVGDGTFTPGTPVLFATPAPVGSLTAIRYAPAGPFEGDLLYADWELGEVRFLAIDTPTGLPIDDGTGQPTLGTTNPRDGRLISDLGQGPVGLDFDPVTGDLYISTWEGVPFNSIIQVRGAGTASSTTSTITSTTTSTTMVTGSVTLPGGGKATTDCYAVFAIGGQPEIVSTKRAECTDGDPTCDLDGDCDDSCRFAVALCLNDVSDPATCTPPAPAAALIKVQPRKAAVDLEIPALDSSSCGAFRNVDVAVKVRKKGRVRKPGKTKLKVVAVSPAKPKKDKDKAVLICRPPEGGCPVP